MAWIRANGENGLNTRPHLCPLPQGEDFTSHIFVGADDYSANTVASISSKAANNSPSPWGEGRDEEVCKTICNTTAAENFHVGQSIRFGPPRRFSANSASLRLFPPPTALVPQVLQEIFNERLHF
jgi:hypothetical protein